MWEPHTQGDGAGNAHGVPTRLFQVAKDSLLLSEGKPLKLLGLHGPTDAAQPVHDARCVCVHRLFACRLIYRASPLFGHA